MCGSSEPFALARVVSESSCFCSGIRTQRPFNPNSEIWESFSSSSCSSSVHWRSVPAKTPFVLQLFCSVSPTLGITGNECLWEDDQPCSTPDCLACQIQGLSSCCAPGRRPRSRPAPQQRETDPFGLSYTQTAATANDLPRPQDLAVFALLDGAIRGSLLARTLPVWLLWICAGTARSQRVFGKLSLITRRVPASSERRKILRLHNLPKSLHPGTTAH
jgi:hypothetical protein